MLQSKTSAYLRLHITVLIFGFTAILGQLISIEALPLVWHRMWIAAVLIFIFLLATGRTDFKLAANGWKIVLAGVLIAAHWVTFFHSIKISNVSVTLACVSTGAFFGSLIEPVVYRRKIDPSEIFLGLLVVGGLYLIFRFEGEYLAGILTALLSAFLAACFQVINGRLVKGNSPFRITFLEMFGGFIGITIYLLLSGKLNASAWTMPAMDWLYLLLLGSACTAYAFIESVAVMRELSPFTVLLSINLEPVYGIILALIIFGSEERMDPYFYVGAGIILSTVFADVLLKRLRRRKQNRLSQNS